MTNEKNTTKGRGVLSLIGETPMVRLESFDTGPCEVWVKLESQNPGGSIKDRIGLAMIEAAEKQGLIHAGGTLVEATAARRRGPMRGSSARDAPRAIPRRRGSRRA